MDLARDPRALLGDCAAELGLTDRSPHACEEHGEGEEAEEVARKHVLAGAQRCEHVVEIREHDQGEGEREPAIEVAPVAAIAQPEAYDRDQREDGEQAVRTDDGGRTDPDGSCRVVVEPQVADVEPDGHERERHEHDEDGERAPAAARPARDEGRERDERRSEEARADRGPGLARAEAERRRGENRRNREGEGPDSDRKESSGEEKVHGAPFDQEPGRSEDGDHRGCHPHRGVERDARVRERVAVEATRGEERHGAHREHADEEKLADEPRPIPLRWTTFHIPLIGRRLAADEGKMESILIADDHPLTREALASLLEQHGFEVVGQASDGEEAIVEAARLRPRLVLLDLTMPGMDGLSALPHIRESSPESEVVVLTASGTDENLLEAIRAGAAGYLLKSEPPERIALFLRGVAHGEAALSGSIARRLLDRVREGGRMGGIPDEVAEKLSAREVEVLLLLDEHLGTDEIAARLYISEHTVRSHVKSLLRKLGVSSRREALERLATARH